MKDQRAIEELREELKEFGSPAESLAYSFLFFGAYGLYTTDWP